MYVFRWTYLPMVTKAKRVKPVTFFRDDFSGGMLASDTDKVYKMRVGTTIQDGNGNNHYIHLAFTLGHESFVELVTKRFDAKRIKWIEWLPPTDEERTESEAKGRRATGTEVQYDGVV